MVLQCEYFKEDTGGHMITVFSVHQYDLDIQRLEYNVI